MTWAAWEALSVGYSLEDRCALWRTLNEIRALPQTPGRLRKTA